MANLTLEALKARHGDCLLMHWTDGATPRLVVIDGGPSDVYQPFLRKRLRAIRQKRIQAGQMREDDPLRIDVLMVSHIDDDHIKGIIELMDELRDTDAYTIRDLWHNSFDDLLHTDDAGLSSATASFLGDISAAASAGTSDAVLEALRGSVSGMTFDVMASVNQGRRLRDLASEANIGLNVAFNRQLILREDDGAVAQPSPQNIALPGGVRMRVLGPNRTRLKKLRQAWDRAIRELQRRRETNGRVSPADVQDVIVQVERDASPSNLSSLVLLVEGDGKRILLTGDALGEDILEAVQEGGLLGADGTMHVDIFKVPHHGSDRNASEALFRTITADHYVISGDGEHHNPERATLRMICNARRPKPFTLHITYRPPHFDFDAFVDDERRQNPNLKVRVIPEGEVFLAL